MCGISGIINVDGSPVDTGLLRRMNDAVSHRGPDGAGFWLGSPTGGRFFSEESLALREGVGNNTPTFQDSNIGLGHRRLAIIDLTDAGLQPMCTGDERLWIVYNGEVYNYIELRKELESLGHSFRSRTDTEVILASYREWGSDCLSRFNGMWAFAILDLEKGAIFVARDRMGIKPLYYHFDGKSFLFASEIKQFFSGGISTDIDYGVLYDYLAHGLVDHSERSFYKGIKQLRGGECLWIPLRVESGWTPEPVRYWDIDTSEKNTGWTDDEYRDSFFELFEDSVKLRLRSDVPIGSCLSGGLDSSGIVCMVNSMLKKKGSTGLQKTFSSCFDDTRYDERRYIEEVVKATKVDAHYVFPTCKGLLEEVEKIMHHQDEPFASTSIYAQWNVFRLARDKGVTVMLDGQGADEILAGYHGYYGSFLATQLMKGHFINFLTELSAYRRLHGYTLIESVRSVLSALPEGRLKVSLLKRYAGRVKWLKREFAEEGAMLSPYYEHLKKEGAKGGSIFDRKLYEMLFSTNLPALLRYEDRNSMAFSIEARLPFLDYRIVEFMFKTTDNQKIRNGCTKYLCREALKPLLPEAVAVRTDKMGFVTPEEEWIRSDLRLFFTDTLGSVRVSDNVFDKSRLEGSFAEMLSGRKSLGFTPWRWVNIIRWRETRR